MKLGELGYSIGDVGVGGYDGGEGVCGCQVVVD